MISNIQPCFYITSHILVQKLDFILIWIHSTFKKISCLICLHTILLFSHLLAYCIVLKLLVWWNHILLEECQINQHNGSNLPLGNTHLTLHTQSAESKPNKYPNQAVVSPEKGRSIDRILTLFFLTNPAGWSLKKKLRWLQNQSCNKCTQQQLTRCVEPILYSFFFLRRSPSSTLYIVWANFALGSNSVKGKARPNILYE